MKAKFRKKTNGWIITLLVVTLIALIFSGISSTTTAVALYMVWITVAITILNDYEITDKGKLKGNGTVINIHRIQKVIHKTNGIDVVYNRKSNSRIRTRHYTPKEVDAFVEQLRKINPNIKII